MVRAVTTRATLARRPSSAALQLLRFQALQETQPYHAVDAFLDELCEQTSLPNPPFWRAWRRVRERDFDGARRDFAEARRRGGAEADIKYAESALLRAEGHLDRAAAHIVIAEVQEANRADAWRQLGRIRALLGRREDASAAYAEALKCSPRLLEQVLRELERHEWLPAFDEAVDDAESFALLAPLSQADREDALQRLEMIGKRIRR